MFDKLFFDLTKQFGLSIYHYITLYFTSFLLCVTKIAIYYLRQNLINYKRDANI